MEGARWDLDEGLIVKSLPKEMFVPMPIINCKGILSSAQETVDVSCALFILHNLEDQHLYLWHN